MPQPKPKEGESKKEFISRCMSDSVMKTEYPKDEDGKTIQRYAVCNSIWDRKNK